MWESAREITEALYLEIERDDGCAYIMSLHCFYFQVKISVLLNFHFWFYMIYRLEVFLSWSIFPRAVAMLGGRCFKKCWLLRPGHVRKFPYFISVRKDIGVSLKQHPWRYWISSVFVLSLVMIAIARCLTGIDMGMSYSPYVLFLCPFKISVLPLRIFI